MNTMRVRQSLLSFMGMKPSSDSLQKLTILYETERDLLLGTEFSGGPIKALFNPSELKFGYDVSWKSSPVPGTIAGGYHRLEFQNCQPVTLGIDLFFDTYEGDPNAKTGFGSLLAASVTPSFLSASPSGVSVLTYTSQMEKLACVDNDLHRPPRCKLRWGQGDLIEGVLIRMTEDFTHFMPDGTPVRALLSCTFQEFIPYSTAATLSENKSPDLHRTRVLKRGETLSSIAQEVYNDAGLWRTIAKANGISDPRSIRPGQVLALPKLR